MIQPRTLLLALASTAVGVLATGCRIVRPSVAPAPPMAEIQINQDCMVRADGASDFSADPVVCHLESRHDSFHREETPADGQAGPQVVEVVEQDYLLRNVTPAPLQFVIEEPVPQGWRVDSEPQPDALRNGVAVFRVVAQPQQVVRLHVGERHSEPARS